MTEYQFRSQLLLEVYKDAISHYEKCLANEAPEDEIAKALSEVEILEEKAPYLLEYCPCRRRVINESL